MLPKLKNLDSRLQQCVDLIDSNGGATHTRLQANSASTEVTSQHLPFNSPLVGLTGSKLRGRIVFFIDRENSDAHVENNEANAVKIQQGITRGTMQPHFEPHETCALSLDSLTDPSCRPVVYASRAQNPFYYRAYDEHHLRQYFNTLQRERRAVRDPMTRNLLENEFFPYDPRNFIPAYPIGTTVYPERGPLTEQLFYQPVPTPVPQVMRYVPPVRENPTVEIAYGAGNLDLSRLLGIGINGDIGENVSLNSRFSRSVATRVQFAIRHFLRDGPNDGILDALQTRYFGVVDLFGLFQRFNFTGDTPPDRINPDIFRGNGGMEDGGIIFLRDRPYNHTFQNGRMVMDEDTYLEFFLFVFHAYFYTGLTDQRISVLRFNDIGGDRIIFRVPYLTNMNTRTTQIVHLEIRLRSYMENTQRWLLTIVNTDGIQYPPTDAYAVDVRQPEFNPETGNALTPTEAFNYEEERRTRAREAALREVQVNATRAIEQIGHNRQPALPAAGARQETSAIDTRRSARGGARAEPSEAGAQGSAGGGAGAEPSEAGAQGSAGGGALPPGPDDDE